MPLKFSPAEVEFREPTNRQRQSLYRPYALELGKLVYAWNHLQETLGYLFSTVLKTNQAMAWAVWHSTPNDRAQRQMLRAAIEKRFDVSRAKRDDVCRMLDKIDQGLSSGRNDAIHAPLTFMTYGEGTYVVPLSFYNNPRAEALLNKELLGEFTWYRQRADVLHEYARKMAHHFSAPQRHSWPDKPRLPERGEQKIAKRKPLVGRGKAHRIQLRSSQE